MKVNKILFFILVLILPLTFVHAASVYKWIDEDGQVHYGSRTDDKNAKEVKIKNRYIDSGKSTSSQQVPQSAIDRAEKQKRFTNALESERNAIQNEKDKKREQKERKIRNCNASRDQLKRYLNSGALYDLDEKGDQILLNKKQYEQAMLQARARVEKWCN